MEVLLHGLLSSDVNQKISSCERLQQKLKENKMDVGIKTMSAAVNLVKEANLKVVLTSLDCLQTLIEERKEPFAAIINMTFDVLIPRLGDTKPNVRDRTKEVFALLVNSYDPSGMADKIISNLSNKNMHIKSTLLETLSQQYIAHADDIALSPASCPKIAVLLNDQQANVRQLALETLLMMQSVFSPILMSTLTELKVKPVYLQNFEQLQASETMERPSPATSPIPLKALEAFDQTTAKKRPIALRRTLSENNNMTQSAQQTKAPVQHEEAEHSLLNLDSQGATGFNLKAYVDFIHGEKPITPLVINDERELGNMLERITTDLGKADDWNKRTQAMVFLQSLAFGTLCHHSETSYIIKKLQDQLSGQLTDLRSTVCKEACKTLAVLAYTSPAALQPVLDFFWPKLVRISVIKIQVMSAAADYCLRVIVSSVQDSRLLQLVLETCTNKNSMLRKLSIEYLSLICALWRTDILEKNLPTMKAVLKNVLMDADAQVRKVARVWYWLLTDYSFAKRMLSQLADELDPNGMKHLQSDQKKTLEYSVLHSLPRRLLPSIQIADPVAQSTSAAIGAVDVVEDLPTVLSTASVAAESREIESFPIEEEVEGKIGGNRRLSLTSGAMRISRGDATGAGVGAGLGGGLMSKPSRRLSLSSLLPASVESMKMGENTFPASIPLAIPTTATATLPPHTPATIAVAPASSSEFSEATEKDEFSDTFHPWAAKTMGGKENRRHSIAPNLPSTLAPSSLLVGAKRVANHSDAHDHPSTTVSKEVKETKETKPTSESSSTGINVVTYSLPTLLKMSEDSSWSVRLKATEEINKRIEKAFVSLESLPEQEIESYIGIALKCQEDTQLKVAAESMKILKLSLEMFHEKCINKLDQLVFNAFVQLNDRRSLIRDIANEILTLLRGKYNANVVCKALIKVMAEVPERTKAAVMQYLGVLICNLEEDGEMLQGVVDMLNKIGDMLSSNNPKPSITLTAASKRIIVSVYKMYPERMANEIVKMKFSSQSAIKSLLKGSIPDLDSALLQATKTLENTRPKASKSLAKSESAMPTHDAHSKDASIISTPMSTQLTREEKIVDTKSSANPDMPSWSPSNQVNFQPSRSFKIEQNGEIVGNFIIPVQRVDVSDNAQMIFASALRSPKIFSSPGVEQISMDLAKDSHKEEYNTALYMKIPGTDRSLQYILHGLATTATKEHRKEVYQLLRKLAKLGDESYWRSFGHQLLEGLLTAAKTMQLSYIDRNYEEEESLLSLLLLLLRHRGALIQTSRLGLLVEMFMAMSVSVGLEGEKLLLYMEIAAVLAKLQAQHAIEQTLTCWPMVTMTFPPTVDKHVQYRVNAQLVLFHALSQSVIHLPQPSFLFEHMSRLVDGIIMPCVQNENIELRKASVFLLVEMYLRLEEGLLPHIQALPGPQRHLMMIYVEKRKASA